MMRPLPPALLRAANRLDQDSPWLILLDVQIDGEDTMYLVNNNEDVIFDGRTYVAFAFTIDQQKESSKGEIPSIQLAVANATRTLQTYVEAYQGGIGAAVTIRIVNAGLLTENYAELTTIMQVLACKCTAQWVTFTLGAINPLNRKFPPEQYIAMHCRYRFKGPHCGYSGAATSCSRTLDNCQQLGNSARFGGFPGLDGRGLRLV
jgi:lambda family phage minor tail protein L